MLGIIVMVGGAFLLLFFCAMPFMMGATVAKEVKTGMRKNHSPGNPVPVHKSLEERRKMDRK